jgi:hypothetical protein
MLQQHPVSNTRATIGKYRNLTSTDWQTVQNRISSSNGKATVTASNGREVTFTRAEVQFLNQKYGTVGA